MSYKLAEPAGAMVISLDFELLWGVRDLYDSNSPYTLRIIHERRVVPQILALFQEYGIAATWAVVGFMFAQTRSELNAYCPSVKPLYADRRLDPYAEAVGEGEWDDPLHYGNKLINQIRSTKRQEIASHTFSHYYCLEPGQTEESMAADLDSALSLGLKHGVQLRSIVFPRNQHNPAYDRLLLKRGIICYRGTEKHPYYQATGRMNSRLPHKRLYRLIDSYLGLSGPHLVSWQDIVEPSGLCNVPSSRYLRPISSNASLTSRFRLKRIAEALGEAARTKQVFHLWTHPQDFGKAPGENLQDLRVILECFSKLQKQYGMLSLSMRETAERAIAYHQGKEAAANGYF